MVYFLLAVAYINKTNLTETLMTQPSLRKNLCSTLWVNNSFLGRHSSPKGHSG